MLLRLSVQEHEPLGEAAIDSTYFDRENASKHYCGRANYCVQTLKTTALVDTDSQAVLDVHCTREKKHDTQIGWQDLREKLRDEGVRPLIKHREFLPINHAHNARIDAADYGQRALSETVFSTIKRTLGHAQRARAWYREFREIVAMCLVYNIKRSVTNPN